MVLFSDNETKLVGGEQVSYFTSVAEDLNLELLGTNRASGQGRT